MGEHMPPGRKGMMGELHAYFGRSWPLFITALAAIIFWPLTVFGPSLSFNSARFTEEWLKTGISSVILLLFLEYLSHQREDKIVSQDADIFILRYYIGPLSSLRLALVEFEIALDAWQINAERPIFPPMTTMWRNFEENLRLVDSAPSILYAAEILSVINGVNQDRIANIIETLQATRSPSDFNRTEYREAVVNIEKLLSKMIGLRKAWET
jgi:hypothetical protein